MKPSTLFTRRMPKNEFGTWLNLAGRAMPEQIDYAKSFIALPDSIYFLASIGGELVGRTAIYRDRTRYAVALVDVYLHPDYRDGADTQLLRSSLPLFRTVVIREVDVLVNSSDSEGDLPFPIVSEIACEFKGTLEALGFQEETRALRCSVEVRRNPSIPCVVSWDEIPDQRGAQDLYWKQTEPSGLDCSQVTLALEVAGKRGFLKTWTPGDATSLAMGIESLRGRALVWPLLADPDEMDVEAIANEIVAQTAPLKPTSIQLPLVGLGQLDIVRNLTKLVDGDLVKRELILMRKKL